MSSANSSARTSTSSSGCPTVRIRWPVQLPRVRHDLRHRNRADASCHIGRGRATAIPDVASLGDIEPLLSERRLAVAGRGYEQLDPCRAFVQQFRQPRARDYPTPGLQLPLPPWGEQEAKRPAV